MGAYITVQGDTWDLIAYKVYGNEIYADVLMQSNYPYLDFFVFPADIVLNVPEVSRSEDDFEIPEWREGEDDEL
jgi:phage tail protein X